MSSPAGRTVPFTFYLSSDVNHQVKVRIDAVAGAIASNSSAANGFRGAGREPEGLDAPLSPDRPCAFYVVAELCAYGQVLGLPSRTRFAEPSAGSSDVAWGDWLAFPTKYRDLPPTAALAVTLFEIGEGRPPRAAGGATLRLFSKRGRLKMGRQSVRLWQGRPADLAWPPATPARPPVSQRGELGRLEQTEKRYGRGEVTRVEWLDRLTLASIARMRSRAAAESAKDGKQQLLLQLELPTFPHAVVALQAAAAVPKVGATGAVGAGRGTAPPAAPVAPASAIPQPNSDADRLIVLHDPEVGRENPAELKAQKLARSVTRGVIDRDLKPDTEERRRIQTILNYPPNRPLGGEDKALLWRFRFSLTQDKRALVKFLKCVDWGDAQEARQAAELMGQWAAIDIADALELLSPQFSNAEVRAAAVAVLCRTDDEELLYYLLQLVQALRYEASDDCPLAEFLVTRAAANQTMAIALHWYLYTEWEDPVFGPRAAAVHRSFQERCGPEAAAEGGVLHTISLQMGMVAQLRHIVQELKAVRGSAARKAERLRDMVAREGQCGELTALHCALPLDPSVMLDGIVPAESSVFKSALAPLRLTFRTTETPTSSSSGAEGDLPPSSPPSVAPPETLGATPGSPPAGALDPGVSPGAVPGGGVGAGGGSGGRYCLIYKKGDDLRQDQLVVQIFSLMDRLLKRENLDLRLTPYRVLPTSSDDGLIECVPSVALARVLAEHRSIHRFLALHHPDPQGPFGLAADVVGTLVRSSAGYCVMTYLLGIGDRHLDNLMLTADGRLFHIDFGFIMGRDPKPFPPPMKLCREMVEAMGGADSEHYRQFRTFCCEAYNILRKSAHLILSLFHLMAGAPIPDLRSDPEKAMLKLQEKLRLDLDDEAAVEWMQQLLNESANALMPQIMETTHRWAQYWR